VTRYFIDTEFFDKGPNDLHLISIALVCDDGRELYLCDSEWLCADGTPDAVMADDWLRANVFPHLPHCKCPPPPEPIQGRPSCHRGSAPSSSPRHAASRHRGWSMLSSEDASASFASKNACLLCTEGGLASEVRPVRKYLPR
jgi:hypothetical protein